MDKIYKRICPKCGKDIFHTNIKNMKHADKIKTQCRECLGKQQSVEFLGKGNPFFGKKHSLETKAKIGKYIRSESTRELAAINLKLNANNRHPYEIWKEKFGIDEANIRMKALREKISINSSGSKNPMYGKPAPEGSGNGWSGWYKGWYFRSLRELSYMIKVIEANSLKWITAESKGLSVKYIDYKGSERTYTADFFIEGKFLVECKPLRLINSDTIKRKSEAAIKFCSEMDYEFVILEPELLSKEEIRELYLSGQIKFLKRYENKMESYL